MPTLAELKKIFAPVLKKVGEDDEAIEALFTEDAPLPEKATTTRDSMSSLMSENIALQNKFIRDTIRKESFEEAEKNLFEVAQKLDPETFTEERIKQINAQKKYSKKGAAIFEELHKKKADPTAREAAIAKERDEWKSKAEAGSAGYEDRIKALSGQVETFKEKALTTEQELEKTRKVFAKTQRDDKILARLRPKMKKFGKSEAWIARNAEKEFLDRFDNLAILETDEAGNQIPKSKANPNLHVYGEDELTPLDLDGVVSYIGGKMGILDKGKGGRRDDQDDHRDDDYRDDRRPDYRREGDGGGDDGGGRKLTPKQREIRNRNRKAVQRASGEQ